MNPLEFQGSKGEVLLAIQIHQAGLPEPEREYRFHPRRRWRFDFAWPEQMLAVEVHGGTWSRGRHTRGGGFEGDREKMNEAQLMGWTVLEFTTGQVQRGQALTVIKWGLRAITQK